MSPPAGHLDNDPRWQFVNDKDWRCTCCGQIQHGLPDMAFRTPSGENFERMETQPNSTFTDTGDILTEDFCRSGDDHFVRAILPIPIQGGDKQFGLGVWCTLSEQNFTTYLNSFDDDDQDRHGPWFSWLGNRLPYQPADMVHVKASLHPRADRQRPDVMVEDPAHPLYDLQRNGAALDQVLDILALCGHDIRPSLPNPTRQ